MLAIQSILVFQAKMKHYNIKLYHLHDSTANGLVSVHYCLMKSILVNILTKPLLCPRLKKLKDLLSLCISQINCNKHDDWAFLGTYLIVNNKYKIYFISNFIFFII